jgi:hypothetical protein
MEFVYFVWMYEQTTKFPVRNIKILFFITEVESVNSAVRTESLYSTDTFRLGKVNYYRASSNEFAETKQSIAECTRR